MDYVCNCYFCGEDTLGSNIHIAYDKPHINNKGYHLKLTVDICFNCLMTTTPDGIRKTKEIIEGYKQDNKL